MIKVGVLGCAGIAKKSLIPAFAAHHNFELSYIGSRDIMKAQSIADAYSCRSGAYDDVVDSDVDLVYIPLPNALHCEWGVKALESGKHVLCEKSLGVTLDEVQKMVGVSTANQRLLLESFQWRFHAQTAKIREIVNSGRIGEIRCFRSSFGFPPFPDGQANIRYRVELGGGALLDAGAYTLKATTEMLGAGFSVKASALRHGVDCNVDLGGAIFLKNQEGLAAELAFGFDNHYQCNYEFWGSRGKLTVTRAFTAPPGFVPEAVLETPDGIEVIKLPADNAFLKMLDYVGGIVDAGNLDLIGKENMDNLIQALLINDVKRLSNE